MRAVRGRRRKAGRRKTAPTVEEAVEEVVQAEPEEAPVSMTVESEETWMPQTGDPSQGNVVGAFARAQAEIGVLTKNAKNTFFKTPAGKPAGYVDLAAIAANVPPVLARHGLAYVQRLQREDNGTFSIVSYIQHEDGSSLPESVYPVLTKDASDPQKFGAGVTYARRYSIMLYLGLAAEDDDGNTAAAPSKPAVPSAMSNLQAALRTKGFTTKETAGQAFRDRWPDVSAVTDLTDPQIREWIAELMNTDQPNF